MEDDLKVICRKLEAHKDLSLFVEVFALYEQIRIEGSVSTDEDMLLYQWGIYDFGGAEHFELDITRQLCTSDPDGDIFQLRSTLYYMVSDELRQIEAGNKWCNSPTNLNSFKEYVVNSIAYLACSYMNPLKCVVEYGRV